MFVANCAGGNNPDQCAASVTAARRWHGITEAHLSPLLSVGVSARVTGAAGWQIQHPNSCNTSVSICMGFLFFFSSQLPTRTRTHPYVLVVSVWVRWWCCLCGWRLLPGLRFEGALWSLVVNKQKLCLRSPFLEVRQTCWMCFKHTHCLCSRFFYWLAGFFCAFFLGALPCFLTRSRRFNQENSVKSMTGNKVGFVSSGVAKSWPAPLFF